MAKIISKSEKETSKFASGLIKKLNGGAALGLVGDLGSGKTAFTKGLAQALGVKSVVTSPTFVLMKVYDIPVGQRGNKNIHRLAHLDAYRLQSAGDLEAIGVLDYFEDKNCLTVIEWADRVQDILPVGVKMVKFKVLEGNNREISL